MKMPILRKKLSLEEKDNRIGRRFLYPAIFVLLCIIAFPVLYSFILSFFRWRPTEPGHRFVAMKNYYDVYHDERFLISIFNTFIYAFIGAFGKIILGMGLALLLNKKFPGRAIARTLLMLPWIIPVTASLTAWNWMLDGMYGVINIILSRMGLITTYINFLGEKGIALACVLILAGLQSIPGELYEAAEVEGAGKIRSFFYITIPSLSGVLKTSIILSIIWTFNAFNVIWLLTRGGSSTHIMNTLAYEFSFINMKNLFGFTKFPESQSLSSGV